MTSRPGRASTGCTNRKRRRPKSARSGARQQPKLFDRLLRVLEEQRGHTLAMEVEDAKIALSDRRKAEISLAWVEPGLKVAIEPRRSW